MNTIVSCCAPLFKMGRPDAYSIAAFQPIRMLGTYVATKAYVLSLSESLTEELRDTGVSVTTL